MELELLDTFLDEAFDMLDGWEAACLRLRSGFEAKDMDALFRAAHNLKGSSRTVGLKEFGECVHKIEDLISAIRNRDLELSPERLTVILQGQAFLLAWIEGLRANRAYQADPNPIFQSLQSVSHTVAPSSTAMPSFGFFSEEPSLPGPIIPPAPKAETPQASPPISVQDTAERKTSPQNPANDETMRVPLRKLDEIQRLTSEIILQFNVIEHETIRRGHVPNRLLESLESSQKTLRELQEMSLSLRMAPIHALFQRLERSAYEVSQQLSKDVQISFLGHDLELDKSILEKIRDPLNHILRNAVDHGLEMPEERKRTGKDPVGHIQVEARVNASSTSILVRDDGAGLKRERILQKAINKGLISPSRKLSDPEIFQLIFLPGFSTAETITNVSGRGVGMDVVRTTIEQLRGRIDIDSEEGKGTSFVITLPNNFSLIDALLFEVEGTTYAAPLDDVEELINPSEYPVTRLTNGSWMLEVHEHIVPLVHVSDLFSEHTEDVAQLKHTALLVNNGFQRVAFMVDRVLNQEQLTVRKLSTKLQKLQGFYGTTIFANGEPGMIVDILRLQHLHNERRQQELPYDHAS